MQEKKEAEVEKEEELDLDALEEVSGGFSLREAPKVKTTEISQDTIHRI